MGPAKLGCPVGPWSPDLRGLCTGLAHIRDMKPWALWHVEGGCGAARSSLEAANSYDSARHLRTLGCTRLQHLELH